MRKKTQGHDDKKGRSERECVQREKNKREERQEKNFRETQGKRKREEKPREEGALGRGACKAIKGAVFAGLAPRNSKIKKEFFQFKINARHRQSPTVEGLNSLS